MTPEKASVAWNIAAGLGVFLLVTTLIPLKSGPHGNSPESRAVNQLKSLTLACRAYKVDFKGEYPSSLSSLFPDYIDIKPLFKRHDENGKNKSPMIYYPGLTTSSDPDTPLIEHPFTFNGKKIVASAGGRVTNEKPAGK